MSERTNPDWIVSVAPDGDLGYCKRCGTSLGLKLPQPISIVVAASNAFVKIHRKCKEAAK